MARVYGELGATKVLVQKLHEQGVHSLQSLDDIENHIQNSKEILKKRRETERERIHRQIEVLQEEYLSLINERTQRWNERHQLLTQELEDIRKRLDIPLEEMRNPIKWLIDRYRRWKDIRRRRVLEEDFTNEVNRPLLKLTKRSIKKREEREYLENNLDKVIDERLYSPIHEKQKIDNALRGLQTWLSGARGELKVLNALQKLPDSFVVINDLNLRLDPPMRSEEGMRFFCQADHVVVGPPGIFNIETKNWSAESVQNLDMRSPVSQIRLAGKAIYRDINRAVREKWIRIKHHHWGEREVRVRNILAMVGAMPKTDFQYVKMLEVSRLCGYLEYFDKMLNEDEIYAISQWLMETSE